MRFLAPSLALALAAASLPAASQSSNCSSATRLNATQLPALLTTFRLVCGRPGPSYPGSPNDRWQEEHRGAGQLWDYKLGASTVDPTKQVGTWQILISGQDASLQHSYGALSYVWTVHGPASHSSGAVYYFCSGGAEFARGFLSNSTTGCGGNYPTLP